MSEQKSQLRIGIVLNYVNMGIGNLVPIFYTPIMLRLLGQEEFGLYKLSSSVTSYLGLISLGIGSAVTRYLIKARTEGGLEAEERMFGLFLVIFRIVAVVSIVAGLFLTLNLGAWYSDSLTADELWRMKILVAIMVVNMALSFSVSPYISLVTSHERYVFYQCMNILNTCFVPVLNLVALYLGFASIGMAIVSLVMLVFVRVAYYIYVKRQMRLSPRYKNMPTGVMKEILIFSFWIFVGNVVGQLYNATDTLMIGAVPALATAAVAVYNIGNTFNSIIVGVSSGMSNILVPRTNRMVFEGASNKELTDYSIVVGRLQCYLMSLIATGFIVFGRPLIHFYVGDVYQDAYWVALCVIVPNMIPLAQSVCLSIVVAKNQHRFRSLMYLAIAIVNVVCTWLVLEDWGIIGAAFVSGMALVLGNGIAMNWYYWKKTGIDIVRFWGQMLKVCFWPMMVCVLCLFSAQWVDLYNPFVLLGSVVVYILLIAVLQWVGTMNDYEKSLCVAPFARLGFKGK